MSFYQAEAEKAAKEGTEKALRKYRGVTQSVKYHDNPILKEGEPGTWDSDLLSNPMVVKNPLDGKYYMFYHGSNPDKVGRIGVAESNDGLSWTKKYGKNPILSPTADWEKDTVIQPYVFLDIRPSRSPLGGVNRTKKWVMYYSNNEKIGRAICKLDDFPYGPWRKDDANPLLEPGPSGAWDETWVKSPSVFFDPIEGKYVMYYAGRNKGVALGRAVSDDGVSWTKFDKNPVLKSKFYRTVFRGLWNCKDIEVCCTFRYKGWVWIVYEGGDYVHHWHIGLAASRGGKNFYRFGENPILNPSMGNQTSEDWDSQWILHPYILRESDRILLYYAGSPGLHITDIELPWKQRIGVAFLDPNIFDRVLNTPAMYAWGYDEPWKNKSIDAGDSVKIPLNCLDYEEVTIYFESDTSGTLTIDVDPLGDGNWYTLDTLDSITSTAYKTSYDFAYLKLSFDTAATVTARVVARR